MFYTPRPNLLFPQPASLDVGRCNCQRYRAGRCLRHAAFLMRWEKLFPLIAKVDRTYYQARAEIGAFVRFIEEEAGPT
jgi:hypothetical protein